MAWVAMAWVEMLVVVAGGVAAEVKEGCKAL